VPQPEPATPGPPDPKWLVASLPQAVFLLTPALTVASVNAAGEHLVGQGASRLIGRSIDAIFRFEEALIADRLADREANLVARGSLVRIFDQPARQIDVMTAPVLHFRGWQLLVLEEPVGVEALSMGLAGDDGADDAVLRAPDVLAHEIKNPLAGIRGAAQLLERRVAKGDRTLTALITTEVDRIAKLVDQMQSLGRRNPEPAMPCNLHEAVRHAQAILAAGHTSNRHGHPVSRCVVDEEFDPSLPLITANHDALVQVLLNLLTNARDACEGVENPRIIVRSRFASGILVHLGPGGGSLRLPIELRVSDNGPGVPPALRDHIFEPFVTNKKSGQGLGLALVQKLVREMNGRVTHDRDEVRGLTHFRLHLPVAGTVPTTPRPTEQELRV
jgi:two-component system nitrogen regulation sensor histidine kinase GlnL